jgi:hypothetical protein
VCIVDVGVAYVMACFGFGLPDFVSAFSFLFHLWVFASLRSEVLLHFYA